MSTAFDLADRLERIGHLLRHQLRLTAKRHGLEAIQLDVLHYLARCNRYSDTASAVAQYFGLTKGTVSQTISALVRKGLVVKRVDDRDQRVSHLELTKTARSILRDASLPGPLADVARPEDEALVAALDDLLARLQRSNDNASFGVCQTCVHFRTEGARYECGLTGEPLRRPDIVKICREHLDPDARDGSREG